MCNQEMVCQRVQPKKIHKLHKYLSEKGWIRNPDLTCPKSCGCDRIHNTACEKSKFISLHNVSPDLRL